MIAGPLPASQRRDGLLSRIHRFDRRRTEESEAALYNHAIAGLTLCELYGMCKKQTQDRLTQAIERALALTMELQDRPKRNTIDEGGWRYWHRTRDKDADLFMTSWQLMFMRSARNAGFHVPSKRIDRAMRFVMACYDPKRGGFRYHPMDDYIPSRPMTGAGILALAHSGLFDVEMARRSGDWLLAQPERDFSQGCG